jgi:hypothetical protein
MPHTGAARSGGHSAATAATRSNPEVWSRMYSRSSSWSSMHVRSSESRSAHPVCGRRSAVASHKPTLMSF